MIERTIIEEILQGLRRQPAVALIGPRQVGKTTLALQIAEGRPSVYLDLEDEIDRRKITDVKAFCNRHSGELIIFDEIHRVPKLFEQLRGIIDQERRVGTKSGRFLLLGSASMDLMQQSETLAGRIAYIDVPPIGLVDTDISPETLWLRGGYPESLLAENDDDSHLNRKDFIRSYLSRDVPLFAPRMPSATIERLWTMLAHQQGALVNVSNLASSLGTSSPSINRYIDLLCDLLLMRKLPPHFVNTKKRLIKTPKTYLRDSGLMHALLNISDMDGLISNPVAGASWEGFVIENLLNALPQGALSSFYRSNAGAEIDLIIEHGGNKKLAFEIKLGRAPKATKGFFNALDDVQPDKAFIIYSGQDRYPYQGDIDVVGVREAIQIIQDEI